MKKPFVLIAGLAALAGLLAGCGPAAAYAATVNGHQLSQSDLNNELTAIRGNKDYDQAVEQQLAQSGEKLNGSGKGTFDSTFVARVLTRQIFLNLVEQGLAKRHIEVTDAMLADAAKNQEQQFSQQFGGNKVWLAFPKTYRDTLARRAAEVQALQNGLSKTKVDDAAIKSYYQAHLKDFSQTCVSHILAAFPPGPNGTPANPTPDQDAAAKAKAQSWKDRLGKGEDFAAIAKAESQDPGSGAKGGDLGCQGPGTFVKEFSDAMDKLPAGQISDPVRSQFGWHVIKVTSRKQQSLADATQQIRQTLEGNQQNAVQDFLQKAVKQAKITVNPKYGTFDKGDEAAGRQPSVVPPKGPTTTSTTAAPGGTGGIVPGGGTGGQPPAQGPSNETPDSSGGGQNP